MGAVFIPQTLFDALDYEGRISMEGGVLRIPEVDLSFLVDPAVKLTESVGRPGDPLGLLGTVRRHQEFAGLGWEHYLGSVIIAEDAYEVEEGFLATPIDAAPPGSGRLDEDQRLRKALAGLTAGGSK
jgi:hypothetical protein